MAFAPPPELTGGERAGRRRLRFLLRRVRRAARGAARADSLQRCRRRSERTMLRTVSMTRRSPPRAPATSAASCTRCSTDEVHTGRAEKVIAFARCPPRSSCPLSSASSTAAAMRSEPEARGRSSTPRRRGSGSTARAALSRRVTGDQAAGMVPAADPPPTRGRRRRRRQSAGWRWTPVPSGRGAPSSAGRRARGTKAAPRRRRGRPAAGRRNNYTYGSTSAAGSAVDTHVRSSARTYDSPHDRPFVW